MTGPEHFAKAEKLMAEAERSPNYNQAGLVAAAQVHATLALAAATAQINEASTSKAGR